MYYTVYKTTNLINKKYYIGKHITNNPNDEYLGSGKWLIAAIKKYGINKFKKEILFVFSNEDEMNRKEKDLVTESFCDDKQNYNLCPGGKGGFGYIIQNGLCDFSGNGKKGAKAYTSKKRSEVMKKAHKEGKFSYEHLIKLGSTSFLGKKHKETTKIIMSEKAKMRKGNKNPAYGRFWVTNGVENKFVDKKSFDKYLEIGYYKGRYLSKD